MLGNKHQSGVKMIFNMKDKTLLEILDLSDCENVLQTMEWDDNGIPIINIDIKE
jgi:hypothetical protein